MTLTYLFTPQPVLALPPSARPPGFWSWALLQQAHCSVPVTGFTDLFLVLALQAVLGVMPHLSSPSLPTLPNLVSIFPGTPWYGEGSLPMQYKLGFPTRKWLDHEEEVGVVTNALGQELGSLNSGWSSAVDPPGTVAQGTAFLKKAFPQLQS